MCGLPSVIDQQLTSQQLRRRAANRPTFGTTRKGRLNDRSTELPLSRPAYTLTSTTYAARQAPFTHLRARREACSPTAWPKRSIMMLAIEQSNIECRTDGGAAKAG